MFYPKIMFFFQVKGAKRVGKRTYEVIIAKQMMNRVKAPQMPFSYSINPYRGCAHGCSFCYARTTHTFLGFHADDTFQHHILVKSNAAEALETQLAKLAVKYQGNVRAVARHVGLVAVGTATDPYQPIEGKAKLTRDCLRVLAKYRIPTSITTRSPLILRDLDRLCEMNIAAIHISVNTLKPDVIQRLEPATSPPRKRLDVVRQLAESGLPAGVFIAPILPYLTDDMDDLEELIKAAKEHRAQFAVPSVLRLSSGVKVWYFQAVQQHYPHLLADYAKLYASKYPDGDYTNALLKGVHRLLEKYGLPSLSSEFRVRDRQFARGEDSRRPKEGEQLAFSF
jgi:DNA repair photolyase